MSDPRTSDLRTPRGSDDQLPRPGLARQLSELARQMQAQPDIDALLDRITAAALGEIDSADHAGISLIQARAVTTHAATDEVVRRLDRTQHDIGSGPCLTSLREQVTVRCDDFSIDTRWPAFATAATATGVRSMLAVQLFVEGDNLGALNIYADSAYAFGEDDESTAMLLASHAAVALKGAQREVNLNAATRNRDVIGQAKGILMERHKLSENQAFDLLVSTSQRTGQRLRDLAARLSETGELPMNGAVD